MQTIKLSDANAKLMYPTALPEIQKMLEDSFGRDFFSTKVEDKIKSFEDCCTENGVDPDDIIPFKEPKNGDEKCINAFAKLIQINRAFNQGKKKNWKNPGQYKYYPWWKMDGSSGSGLSFDGYAYGRSHTSVASRLLLLDSSHVEHLVNLFPDIYEDYMTE